MVDYLLRFKRLLVSGPAIFTAGAMILADSALHAQDDSINAMLMKVIVGLLGVIGPLIVMLSSLIRKRERLARGDVVRRVEQLEQESGGWGAGDAALRLEIRRVADDLAEHEREEMRMLDGMRRDSAAAALELQKSVNTMSEALLEMSKRQIEMTQKQNDIVNLLTGRKA